MGRKKEHSVHINLRLSGVMERSILRRLVYAGVAENHSVHDSLKLSGMLDKLFLA